MDAVTDAEIAAVTAKKKAYEELEKKLGEARDAQKKVAQAESGSSIAAY